MGIYPWCSWRQIDAHRRMQAPQLLSEVVVRHPCSAPKDKKEQRAIAHTLGTLDDKIELNRRMNETLEGNGADAV